MCGGTIQITTPVGCTSCSEQAIASSLPNCIHPIDYLFEQALPIAVNTSIHIVDAVILLLDAGLVVTEKEDFCEMDNTHNYAFYGFSKVAKLSDVVTYMRSMSTPTTCATKNCVNFHGSLTADLLYKNLFPNKPLVCETDFATEVVKLMNEIASNITVLNLGICESNSFAGVSAISRIISNIKALDADITVADLTTKITNLLDKGLFYKPSPTGHIFASGTGFVTWLTRYGYNDMCA